MALVGNMKTAPLPIPPSFWQLIGPSFILLGLGLGSGELILWPYLTANYGLGIIWGAVVGITLQFFLNMEVERYTLAKGESVFVGLARKFHIVSPLWFFLSTFVPWMWPGIIATAGLIIAHVLGLSSHVPITIGLLIGVGLLLSTGKTVYRRLESWQRWSISLGVPFILILTLWLVKPADWTQLTLGLVGRGEGFTWFPEGLSLLTFLGALAYSGAGGNLNLAQSFYIKDKGYGMGKHSGQITSMIRDQSGTLTLEGFSFKQTPSNLAVFHRWWRLITIEHGIVFWLTGLITMLSLSALSYATVFRSGATVPEGVNFLFVQAEQIGLMTVPALGTIFLVVTAIMLFSTQTSIFDATSRIMAENLIITNKKIFPIRNLGFYYYCFLWLQITLSIVVLQLGFTQPFKLVIVSAVLNALSMGIYSVLLFWLNTTQLEPSIRPNLLRRSVLLVLSIFFGIIAIATLVQN